MGSYIIYNNREEIYNILPQRYPYMILDKLSIEGNYAEGTIYNSEKEWYFDCHFPGNPVMPGFLIVESMSQVLLSTFISSEMIGQKKIPIMAGVRDIVFDKVVRPNEVVYICAELKKFKYGVAKGEVRAYSGTISEESKVASASFSFIMPDMISM